MLFNIAAIWSQIGAKQDRRTEAGLKEAIDAFQKAAGVFKFIKDNFINSPSADLTPEVMEMLMAIMLAQAQVCIWEELILGGIKDNLSDKIVAAQECSQVSLSYKKAQMMMNSGICLSCVPISWRNMMSIMCLHYEALSHYYVAEGILKSVENQSDDKKDEAILSSLGTSQTNSNETKKKHVT